MNESGPKNPANAPTERARRKVMFTTVEEVQEANRKLKRQEQGRDPEELDTVYPGSEESERAGEENRRRRRNVMEITPEQLAEAKKQYERELESRKRIAEQQEQARQKETQRQIEAERSRIEALAESDNEDEVVDEFPAEKTQPGAPARFTPTQEINLNRPNPKKVETQIIQRPTEKPIAPEEKKKGFWSKWFGSK